MNKAYIFIYNSDVGSRDEIKDFLDGRWEIVNWRHELPNTFFLVSPNSAQEISDLIASRFRQDKGKFLICEIGSNRQGYLSSESWTFFKEKKAP